MEAWDLTKKLGLDFRTCYWTKSFAASKITNYAGLNVVYSDSYMANARMYGITRIGVASLTNEEAFAEEMKHVKYTKLV